jgi:uncharacterized protein (TIGR00297 family)
MDGAEDVRWALPLVIAALALRLRLLQPLAAVAGLAVGLCVIYSPQQPAHSLMLLTFFVAGSGSTKLTARLRAKKAAAAAGATVAIEVTGGKPRQRRRRRTSRSPSAPPSAAAASTTTHVKASDASDAKRGRTLEQVLAVGLVPALLCVAQERWHRDWGLCYLCYLAACAGDTLASEFGSLASARPLLVTTLRPVAAGQDGAISLAGTIASLVGGALVGACAGTPAGLLQGIVAGGAGSLLDSVLGALLQRPELLAGKPRLWKSLNCLVNLLSSSAIAAAAPLAAEHARLVLPPLALLLLLLCAATTGLSGTDARKVLHLGTSVLVVFTDAASPSHLPGSTIRPLLLALAALVAAGSALSWSRVWSSSPLARFEAAPGECRNYYTVTTELAHPSRAHPSRVKTQERYCPPQISDERSATWLLLHVAWQTVLLLGSPATH